MDGYQVNSGTSFASPFVAGAVALLLSRAQRAGRTLRSSDVKRLLTTSASALKGPADEVGHGLLDAHAALRLLDSEMAGRGARA